MADFAPYLCRLCLFKIELLEEDQKLIENNQEIETIILEIFSGKVKLHSRLKA